MENVIFINGLEDYITGFNACLSHTSSNGDVNLDFIQCRQYDRMILRWIYSSLTQDVMIQITGYMTSHATYFDLEHIFSASSKAQVMQLRLKFLTTNKGALKMMD